MKLTLLLVLIAAIPLDLKYIRWNASPSVPVGVYLRSSEFHRGDIVEVCAPDAIAAEGLAHGFLFGFGGPCYHGSFPLVKVLAGVGGDVVDVSAAGITINGKPWPASQRRYVARDGKPVTQWIPYGRMVLPSERVLVLGTHPESWDSRVWSAIPATSVRDRWAPLLTMKGY